MMMERVRCVVPGGRAGDCGMEQPAYSESPRLKTRFPQVRSHSSLRRSSTQAVLPSRHSEARSLLLASSGRRCHASALTYVRHCRIRRSSGSGAHSCSMGCAGSNIAATIPPASRSSTATMSKRANAPGASPGSRSLIAEIPRTGHLRHQPHSLGHPREADRSECASAF